MNGATADQLGSPRIARTVLGVPSSTKARSIAVAMTIVALSGCAGGGRTNSTVDVEVSQPVDSMTTPGASTTNTVENLGDAAAAEFTRSLFADLPGDEPGCTVAVGRGMLVQRGFDVMDTSPTIADALAALADVVDLRFAPGSKWEYSNSNYFLLSQIVLAVTGEDLGTFLAAEVFEPLGHDMVLDPIGAIENKAVSYEQVGGEWHVADSHWQVTIGTGSIQTTPSQLVVWAAQYWEPTIGATTIDAERFEGAVDTEEGKYGAGIVEADVGGNVGRMLNHNGHWDGFYTVSPVATEHRVAIAVTCTSPTAIGRIRHHRTFDRDLLASWIGGS